MNETVKKTKEVAVYTNFNRCVKQEDGHVWMDKER